LLANALIGLREGLEAGLVVGILVAYLHKIGRRDVLPRLWIGIAGAILLSLIVGAILTFGPYNLSFQAQEALGGSLSILAVGMVTWMIFWMRRSARTIKAELTGKLTDALGMGPMAVATLAFIAVLREGLEMVLLVFSAAQAAAQTVAPLAGMLAGLATAILLGRLMYAAVARVDLGRLFTWTAVLLILVAAGIAKYAVHGFQTAGALPGFTDTAYDFSGTVEPTSWYGTLLAATVNLTPSATVLEITVWFAYAIGVLLLFFRPAGRKTAVTQRTAA
jgi:high-affinity iron transporter